jgi:cellulose synthase/poly-beta-1,6-N-acetylglucosamine synthase-like glycosyltransferase
MFEQPNGWLRASLPKIEAASRSILAMARDAKSITEARADFLDQRWRQLTGVAPSDTRFTISFPVHNEERSLPSVLGAFFASELPTDAEIQVIFLVNASSDHSAALIKKRLASIGPTTDTSLSRSFIDAKRLDTVHQVCLGKMRFLVAETSVPGKANALNICNEIACEQGHEIAINIDANNWVEPDSIGLMYRQARRTIIDDPHFNAALINACEYCPTRNEQAQVSIKTKTQRAEVSGCMFAWSTQWIHENNGFPQYAIEDYGSGLLALMQGKKIVESDAKIWVFSPSNPSDEERQMVRFIYGAMQLAEYFHDHAIAKEILREDFPQLLPWSGRLEYYIKRIRNRNTLLKIIKCLMRCLMDERLIFHAQRELRRNPRGQTWKPIRSTK